MEFSPSGESEGGSGTLLHLIEPNAGLEPATYALRMRCSTN